jgi:apolipoprotein N-acyltransferase
VVTSGQVVEHRSSRTGRWLRERRLRFALLIAVVEGLLVAFSVIPWWLAVLAAAALVVTYFSLLREFRSDTVRQIGWIAATSQALVVLVPILVAVVGVLAVIAVGVLAVLALVVLFSDRG